MTLEELLALNDIELARLAEIEVFGTPLRDDPENRLNRYLKRFSVETRKRLCAVLEQIDSGQSSTLEGAALAADLLASASGKPTPFSLVVFLMRRGREKFCIEPHPDS